MDPADPAKRGTLTQLLEAHQVRLEEQNRQGLAQEAARAQGQEAVLNALRHQWNPHSALLAGIVAPVCAQRLAASMESSHCTLIDESVADTVCSTPCGINGILTGRVEAQSAASPGAQRLAASMESSDDTSAPPVKQLNVLNALRHQWNPHSV